MELAVLTGDIVASQKLQPAQLDAVFEALRQTAQGFVTFSELDACFTRIRGDGWQAVARPDFALRSVFLLRAAVRSCGNGFETRLALGIGEGEIRGSSLGDASGPAFVASGHALDRIRRARRVVGRDVGPVLEVSLPLADRLSGTWTARQAEVALYALRLPQPTREEVAQRLGVTRQTIQGQWEAAHLDAIAESCRLVEERRP